MYHRYALKRSLLSKSTRWVPHQTMPRSPVQTTAFLSWLKRMTPFSHHNTSHMLMRCLPRLQFWVPVLLLPKIKSFLCRTLLCPPAAPSALISYYSIANQQLISSLNPSMSRTSGRLLLLSRFIATRGLWTLPRKLILMIHRFTLMLGVSPMSSLCINWVRNSR